VQVDGALFFIGTPHTPRGDSEISGTAILRWNAEQLVERSTLQSAVPSVVVCIRRAVTS
jgi:acetamidase/formamidase